MAEINILASLKSKKRLNKAQTEAWISKIKNALKSNGKLSKKELSQDKFAEILKGSSKKMNSYEVILNELSAVLKQKTSGTASLIPIPAKELKLLGSQIVKALHKEHLRNAVIYGKTDDWKRSLGEINRSLKLGRKKENGISDLKPPINTLHHWIYAEFMVKGNTPGLRENIKNFSKLYPNDVNLIYWNAHYNIMAGKFKEAFTAIKNIPYNENQRIDAIIRSIIDPSRTKNHYIPFPCNFYTYRYTLMDNEKATQFSQLFNREEFSDVKFFGKKIVEAYREWDSAIDAMNHQNYSGAINYLNECRKVVLEYLLHRHKELLEINTFVPNAAKSVKAKLKLAADKIIDPNAVTRQIYYMFRRRYVEINLNDLHEKDWERPMLRFKIDGEVTDIFNDTSPGNDSLIRLFKDDNNPKIREKIDAPLILLGMVFIPLATIESYRQTRQYDLALNEANELLRSHDKFKILSQFIEVPFLKILMGQIMMEKADSQYKAGELVKHSTAFSLSHQNLQAASTYKAALDLFLTLGFYVGKVQTVSDELRARIQSFDGLNFSNIPFRFNQRLGENFQLMDTAKRQNLSILGKELKFPQFEPRISSRLSVFPSNSFPSMNILKYNFNAERETNPLIYSIVLEAKAKLLQLSSGLNWLGYPDSYIPPWKFTYLVDRARYYADQAKNLQRDYLNFISNAEREQFQEMSVSQTVTMEQMNVTIDEARVEQGRAELEAARESEELAHLQALNSQKRLDNYTSYDSLADGADFVAGSAMVVGAGAQIALASATGSPADIAGAVSGSSNAVGGIASLIKEGAQREMEKKNLELSIKEAAQAELVAEAQIDVSEAALQVASLQAQASVMRHEFAIMNYEFLKNRLTNAELWFRLAHSIRNIANIYLKRAIEMSFLAEQVYEFMVDKQINVIRFDYDNDSLGDMLAADYLKADLDYLESHLVFTQREKQQQVKCVVSLSRDFPEALRELRDNESAIIPITLEYLERRFPGLYNLKVSAVETQPLAIMDPTRFNIELTFMGSGLLRSKAYPVNHDGSVQINNNNCGLTSGAIPQLDPAILNQSWLTGAEAEFPVNTLIRPTETCVFTGLTPGEDNLYFQSFSTQQKNFFEDTPAAAGWYVDMGMTENHLVPGSLAELTLTFYLTGYYDKNLKNYIDNATTSSTSLATKVFSARSEFSDQYFSFTRSGEIAFPISAPMLAINERIDVLNQLGIYFMPAISAENYTRFYAHETTKFTVNLNQTITITETPPVFNIRKKFGTDNKVILLTVQLINAGDNLELSTDESPSPATVAGSTRRRSAELTFTTAGKHVITARVLSTTLSEYRLEIFISEDNPPLTPNLAFPEITYAADKLTIKLNRLNNSDNIVDADHSLNAVIICFSKEGKKMFRSGPGQNPAKTFDFFNLPPDNLLAPGEYFIVTLLTEPITANFKSFQKPSEASYECEGNKLATKYDDTNLPVRVPLNDFSTDLNLPNLFPLDMWTFRLDTTNNSFINVYDCNGNSTIDLSIFNDVLLFMEYKLKRRLSSS